MTDLKTKPAQYLASKQVVATTLSTREMEDFIPRTLRNRAMFSARTIYAEHLAQTQADIQEILDGKISPSEARTRMGRRLKKLSYRPDPADEGGIKDLSSDLRTNLIIDQQIADARGYAVWRSQQNDSILKVWPAQEMYRTNTPKVPRKWRIIWNGKRRKLGEAATSATYAGTESGPFKALKNDPIWTAISRFGNPWPPFDFRSGMRLRPIRADAARESGLLTDASKLPKPHRDPMEQPVSVSIAGMPADLVDEWIKPFKDRARIVDGRLHLAPPKTVVQEIVEAGKSRAVAKTVFGWVSNANRKALSKALDVSVSPATMYELDADAVRHIHNRHGIEHEIIRAGKTVKAGELQKDQIPVTHADMEKIPEIIEKPGTWEMQEKDETPESSGRRGTGVKLVTEDGWHLEMAHSHKEKAPRLRVVSMWRRKPTR